MAENTNIEWCDHTFNAWIGCTKVHTGCKNCYAEADFDIRRKQVVWGPNGTRRKTSGHYWTEPYKWNKQAERDGIRRRVFCSSLADMFEDWYGPIIDHRGEQLYRSEDGRITTCIDWTHALTMHDLRKDLFKMTAATPNLDWMVLTKRPENIRKMLNAIDDRPAGLKQRYRKNVWLYASVSDQESSDKMIPELLKCRDLVPVLGVSAEPLLGPIDFDDTPWPEGWEKSIDALYDYIDPLRWTEGHLDHVIVGGESGPNARPCPVEYIGDIIRQCKAAHVPCFVKQLGAFPVTTNANLQDFPEGTKNLDDWGEGIASCRYLLKDKKGGDLAEWPHGFHIREMPEAVA